MDTETPKTFITDAATGETIVRDSTPEEMQPIEETTAE